MLQDSVGYPPDLAAVDMTAIASAITIDSSGQYLVEGLAYIVDGTALPDPAQSTQEGVTELGYMALPELETLHSNHSFYQKRPTEKKRDTYGLCGKSLGHKNYLRTCNQKRTEGCRFACSTCGKTFNDSSNFLRHQNTHTRKKQYECGVCSRIFFQKSNLIRHEKRHRGDKSYVCPTCSKGFVTKFELKTHEIDKKTDGRKPV